jgi:3-oxoacyl-[acyl-carrier-protein] synthase III
MIIKSIEYYLPSKVLSNTDLQATFPEWDSKKTEQKIGISQRHVVDSTETALDLGEMAAKQVLKKYNRADIDFLLFCTQSPDYYLPTTACILQKRLQLNENVGALDFNLGCSGFVYGLCLAKGLIAAGASSNVLLVVAETYSKHIYEKDIANLSIFGDGAAAVLVSKHEHDCLGEFVLGTDGSGENNLIVRNGGFRNCRIPSPVEISSGSSSVYTENHLYMNGPEVFNFTINKIPDLVKRVLAKNSISLLDVDYFVFHQANSFMLEYLRKKIGIPQERFYNNLKYTGNTVSATIPIAIKDCMECGLIKEGHKVMVVGFGVGYSWGATIITI